MFKRAGSELLVYCDDDTRQLRIATDTPLAPGFKEHFREIASFGSEEEWLASSYHDQITDEDVLDMIDWFWFDLEKTTEPKAKKFRCRWCDEVFESEFGAYCTHCFRFMDTANPMP